MPWSSGPAVTSVMTPRVSTPEAPSTSVDLRPVSFESLYTTKASQRTLANLGAPSIRMVQHLSNCAIVSMRPTSVTVGVLRNAYQTMRMALAGAPMSTTRVVRFSSMLRLLAYLVSPT